MSRHDTLSGWGRWPKRRCHIKAPRHPEYVSGMLAKGPVIARGLGRGYGDCALSLETTLGTTGLNRFASFDPETGILVAEAGVSLAEIIAAFPATRVFPARHAGHKICHFRWCYRGGCARQEPPCRR